MQLRREIGAVGVFTICAGAMIGSGIFVLPGVAIAQAGPAAALAYFLAGVVALPATLSQAELISAMPQAGGIYHFVYRAWGPLPATVIGLGTWLVMMLKSAFGLVGLGIYVSYVVHLPVIPVALAACVLVTGTNLLGIKRTTTVQNWLVFPVLGSLVFFILLGFPAARSELYEPLLTGNLGTLLFTTGLVYISYVGITRVAAVGGEIKNPGRDSALGMMLALAAIAIAYVGLVWVVAGVLPREESGEQLTAVPLVAQLIWGRAGSVAFAIAGVLALMSVANAGVLTAARFPFAMAKNGLMPAPLQRISGRGAIPVTAVLVTGGLMFLFIATIPVVELAKLAGIFNLLVLASVNLTVFRLRQAPPPWYAPSFRSPGYPWAQWAGVVLALSLVGFIGKGPQLATGVLILGGILWYLVATWRTRKPNLRPLHADDDVA